MRLAERAVRCLCRCQCWAVKDLARIRAHPFPFKGQVDHCGLSSLWRFAWAPTFTLSPDRVFIYPWSWTILPHLSLPCSGLQGPPCWDHLPWPDPLGTRASECCLSRLVSSEIRHVSTSRYWLTTASEPLTPLLIDLYSFTILRHIVFGLY